MEEIGGYFAKLSLITDGASFDKGKDALDSIGPAADNAAKAVQKLEALYGGFSKQGHIYVPSGSVQSTANEGDEAPKENERKQKAVTAASTLYVLKEVVTAAKKIISAIDKLVGAAAQQTQASVVSAARSGFTVEALNKWLSALGNIGVNTEAFTSAVTNVETAFNRLKVGDPSGFAAIATPLAILASESKKANVNPVTLMGMDNESRTKAILDAALSISDTKKARTLLEQIYGDVGGQLYEAARARGITETGGILSKAGVTPPTPTQEALAASDTYKQTTSSIESYMKILGTGIMEGMQPYLAVINKELGLAAPQKGTEDIGRIIGTILGIIAVPIATLATAVTSLVEAITGFVDWLKKVDIKLPNTDDWPQFSPISSLAPAQINIIIHANGTNLTPSQLSSAVQDGFARAVDMNKLAVGSGKPV